LSFDKKCKIYSDLLLSYNKIHRISGVKNKDEIKRYIADSIYPKKFIEDRKKIVDIGSGAGFPGLIIACRYPKSEIYLIEPNQKKSAFLHLAKSKIGLANVTIFTKRAEECDGFEADLIVSRAVSKVDMLLEISKGFIGKKSELLLYKGSSVEKELDKNLKYDMINNGNRNYLLIKDIK